MQARLKLSLLPILALLSLTCSAKPPAVANAQSLSPPASPISSTEHTQSPVAVLVTAAQANLRAQPGTLSAIVDAVGKDDLLLLASTNPVGPWYRVRRTRSATEAWIHGNNIALLYLRADYGATTSSTVQRPRTASPPVTSGRSYINVDGVRVQSPVFSDTKPPGASARCRDGTYSFSQHRRGTCSWHGGVAKWY